MGGNLPAILSKEIQGILIDAVCYIAQGSRRVIHIKGSSRSGGQHFDAGEGKVAGIVVEVVIPEVAELAAKLPGMASVNPAQRVGAHRGGVATTRREPTLSTKENAKVAYAQ